MNKRRSSKLSLSRETVQNLGGAKLARAQGAAAGGPGPTTVATVVLYGCPSLPPVCSFWTCGDLHTCLGACSDECFPIYKKI